jgi:hypothetical protein
MQSPKISVIVLNWNGRHFLQTCLSSLRRQIFTEFETLLVDNGSKDGSVDYVRENFPEVRIVALKENRGFTGGNIAGWESSRGELVALLNNDTEVHPAWLAALERASNQYPEAGSFASKMLCFEQRDHIDNCGFLLSRGGFSFELGRGDADGPEYSRDRSVFGACGGAVAYRRGMLEEIGFLDPDFFLGQEDFDLSFRAQLAGYRCMFIFDAIVYHRITATMTKFPARLAFFSQRNAEFAYIKSMPFTLMLRYLPERLVYWLGSALFFTRMGVGGAFLKSKFAVLRHLPTLLRKRAEIKRTRRLSPRELNALMRGGWFSARWKRFISAFVHSRRKGAVNPTSRVSRAK